MAELGRVALTTYINTNVNTNGVKAITGAIMNTTLIDFKDSFYNKVDDRPYVGLKTYAPTTVYDTGDTVIYVNDIYEANQDTVTGAWNPAKWDKVLDTVADFEEGVDDRVAALIQDGTGLTWTYNDVANTLTGNVDLTISEAIANGSTHSGAQTFDIQSTDGTDRGRLTIDITGSAMSNTVIATGVGATFLADKTYAEMDMDNNGTNQKLVFNGTNMTVTDTTNSKGLIYAADYSGAFVNESLITKRYVDTNFATVSSGAATQVAFFTGANTQSSDSNFIWNNTNKNLGLGAAPDSGFHLHIKESTNKAQLRIESTTTENAVLSIMHSATGGTGDRNSAITFKEDATTHWTMGLNGTGGGADDEFILVNGTDMDTNPVIVAQKTNGYVGINTGTGVNPTALLHIGAPTTSHASLRLTASAAVNPSAPNSGDLWWNGTNLYFYNGSSNTDLLSGGGGATSIVNSATLASTNTTVGTANNGVFLGQNAGSGSDGTFTVAIGNEAGSGQDGAFSVWIGDNAGTNATGAGTTNATDCVGIGYRAGYKLTTADQVVAIGGLALTEATDGPGNVAVGYKAGQALTTGDYNIFVGFEAGNTATTGNNGIYIGKSVQPPAAGTSNYMTIGDIVRGDTSAAEVYAACPNAAAADADLNNSEVHWWVDESGNNLTFKVKYAAGTVKSGTVALT